MKSLLLFFIYFRMVSDAMTNGQRSAGDVLNDIGSMLSDLTDELDAMLHMERDTLKQWIIDVKCPFYRLFYPKIDDYILMFNGNDVIRDRTVPLYIILFLFKCTQLILTQYCIFNFVILILQYNLIDTRITKFYFSARNYKILQFPTTVITY